MAGGQLACRVLANLASRCHGFLYGEASAGTWLTPPSPPPTAKPPGSTLSQSQGTMASVRPLRAVPSGPPFIPPGNVARVRHGLTQRVLEPPCRSGQGAGPGYSYLRRRMEAGG